MFMFKDDLIYITNIKEYVNCNDVSNNELVELNNEILKLYSKYNNGFTKYYVIFDEYDFNNLEAINYNIEETIQLINKFYN